MSPMFGKRTITAARREALAAYAFLMPNFLGFLAFTSIPVVLSLVMAFCHWNIFRPPSWVGLENFRSLLWFHRENGKLVANDPFFWQYVYNTVYLMAGIPVGMAGSLVLALMMNQRLRGIVVLRTIYFLPTVCSGVALLILWKYLYNADIGLINKIIRAAGAFIYSSRPVAVGFTVMCAAVLGLVATATCVCVFAALRYLFERVGWEWSENALKVLAVTSGAVIFAVLGAYGRVFYAQLAAFFTTPPDWLGTVKWAKPSLILMSLWGGLGGYNMILYLAALQGVPTSYYEAAEIDGAGPWAKFWSVTWPMISPTTFFILIMSIISGFQSGFMTANILTNGGPAGSTTTIEYYLYQTAFEKFNMGYASAIAWFLFAVILILTRFTWRIGGRVVVYE
ncbi:MAG: sugar ABC transporter permease [Armatimonadota bacterium]|nr:sugar ABC transporter permease [Armatimonadota bacterium]